MLSPADMEVVRRDPEIPGLGLVLDNEALAERLKSVVRAAETAEVQAKYVRYKPKTSCLTAYQVRLNGVETELYAKAYNPNAGAKVEKARNRKGIPGALGFDRAFLKDECVILFCFPNDRKLAALARLAEKKGRRDLLATLLPERVDLRNARVQSLHYKPERRYVAKLTAKTGGRAVIKVYVENEYPTANCGARAIASQGILRVARRLGGSRRHGMLVFEWLKGQPFQGLLHSADFVPETAQSIGAALAQIHAQAGGQLRHRPREVEAVALLSAAEACAVVCPHLAHDMRNLALRLSSELLKASCQARPIHGDFTPHQVLIRNGNIGVLDFDCAVLGDPAADIGAFSAQLETDELRGLLPSARKNAVLREFLKGYSAARGFPAPPGIRLYTAAGLLLLAPHPFRNREPDWLHLTQRILERAMETADSA